MCAVCRFVFWTVWTVWARLLCVFERVCLYLCFCALRRVLWISPRTPPSSSSVFYQAAQWVTLRRTNITSRSTFLRLHILLAGALFLKLPRDQSSLSELRDIVALHRHSLFRSKISWICKSKSEFSSISKFQESLTVFHFLRNQSKFYLLNCYFQYFKISQNCVKKFQVYLYARLSFVHPYKLYLGYLHVTIRALSGTFNVH